MSARTLALILASLLAVAISGCEAVLGTGDLKDDVAGSDGGHVSGDDDDDDDDDASVIEAGTDDGSTHILDATSSETGALDASDSGDAAGGRDAGDGSAAEGGSDGPPSCAASANGTANTCGVDLDDDCCATEQVGGDTYYRTYDVPEYGDFDDQVSVSTYNLDAFEVTVGRMRAYAAYLAAGGAAPAVGSGLHTHLNDGRGLLVVPSQNVTYESGWLASYNALITSGANASATFASTSCATTYTPSAAPTDNRPMNCVTWYDAYAFCIWDGGFLPTEAEWELAASGGSLYDDYPWGNTPAPTTTYAVFGCSAESASCPAVVGSAYRGESGNAQFDLLGNVAEWTLDDYASTYLDSDNCTDCAELNTGVANKVDRGGAYTDISGSTYLTPQGRGSFAATTHNAIAGFRCARAVPP